MCEVGDWVRKIHDALKDLDAQKSPRYEAKLKKLSLHMIRCTEFIKSKRPSFEDSAIVNTILASAASCCSTRSTTPRSRIYYESFATHNTTFTAR